MTKREILKIIKENSYMKYCICQLIENIKDIREYRNLKMYLEQIIIRDNESNNKNKKNIDELYKRLKENKEENND